MDLQNKIEALTKYELEFLLNNPEHLSDVCDFFAKGGFHSHSEEAINKKYEEEFEA